MGQEAEMARRLRDFLFEEQGQDLVEYAVILFFIVIAYLAFAYNGAGSVHGIWTREGNDLVSANSTARGG
jgi:Flp pilus assembly pilin Flp